MLNLYKAFGIYKDHDVNVPFNMPEDHHDDFIDGSPWWNDPAEGLWTNPTSFRMRFGEGPGAINASIVHDPEEKNFYIDNIARVNVKDYNPLDRKDRTKGVRQPSGLKPGFRLQSFLDKLSEANPDHTMSALAHDEKRAKVYSRSGFNIEGRMEGSVRAGTGEPTPPEHQTHVMSRPSWNDLYKAFGIYKDAGIGQERFLDPERPDIPDSLGTLAYEPVKALHDFRQLRDDEYLQDIVHKKPHSYTPHEAATEASQYIKENNRPIFYVADDAHMVRFKPGDEGMEVDHVAHGKRANRALYSPDGTMYHRDKVANDWLYYLKQHPAVSRALPLPGGLNINKP